MHHFGRVLGVQWEGEAGEEVMVEQKDAKHQKRATKAARFWCSREGGAGGEVEITKDT